MSELEHCRSVLLRVVNELSEEELDFQIFPDSKSIGELLLHVAAFEFLMVAAAAGETPDHSSWRRLKPGFSREAGFQPPRGHPIKEYLDALAEVRVRTIGYFGENVERRFVSKAKFPIATLTAVLRDNDPEPKAVELYDKISRGIESSFRDDGAENQRGEIDLVHLLQLHETYHRGHITLQKYLYARLQQRSGAH